MKRKYWIGLLAIIRTLCRYYTKYGGKLPSDMPTAVLAAEPYIRAACLALEAYDLTHSGGEGNG